MSKPSRTDAMNRAGMPAVSGMSLVAYHPAAVVVEHVQEVVRDAAVENRKRHGLRAGMHHAGNAFMTWLESGAAAERRRAREHSL